LNSLRRFADKAVVHAKKLWYGGRGEPIRYGNHSLRYAPGTRPPRTKYLETGDPGTRNELRQIEYFLANVRAEDVALDVGAHAGQYAVLLGSLVGPKGRVFSFEPDATARALLNRNIALNEFSDRISVEPIALSDVNGSHEFFSLGGNSMSSLARTGLGSKAESSLVARSIVPTMRLDDFIVDRALDCPQWIKIDTEGAEIRILRAATKTLRCVRGVLCELHPYAWPEFGSTFDELLSVVGESGRSIRYLDPDCEIADGPMYGTVVIA
jgi:FkbM family methyltransferase